MLIHLLHNAVDCCEQEKYLNTYIDTFNYENIPYVVKEINNIMENYGHTFTL